MELVSIDPPTGMHAGLDPMHTDFARVVGRAVRLGVKFSMGLVSIDPPTGMLAVHDPMCTAVTEKVDYQGFADVRKAIEIIYTIERPQPMAVNMMVHAITGHLSLSPETRLDYHTDGNASVCDLGASTCDKCDSVGVLLRDSSWV
eukprot:gene6574-3226_t